MRNPSLLIAAAAVAWPALAHAQCTPGATNFCVTLGNATPNSPNPGNPGVVYYINGVEAAVVTLTRGTTYTFRMVNVSPSHPFYLCTTMSGGGSSPWVFGVSPLTVSGNQTMTFNVPQNAPSTLWYGCDNHDDMGWRIDIINAPAACYANCDASTTSPILNVADFTCFLQRFAAGESYANCDQSTLAPTLNVADFTCFLQQFAAGCP